MGPRQRIDLVALAVFIVLISFFIASQAGTEYLTWSIDCGSDHNYTDQATGIPWVTDEAFIKTGKNARNVTIYPSNEAYVNKEQLRTLRYFDDSRQRHCYVLPVKNRTTYLLRATFFLGNLTDSTKRDISFIVRINATRWQSFPFDPEYDYNRTRSKEAIIYSQGAVLNICLTKSRTTVAFISTLELREFTTGMYSSAAAGGYQFQLLDNRINSGMKPAADNEPLSYLRYPDDPYDRLWWSSGSWDGLGRITNTRRSSSSLSLQMQNRPPEIVMDDAWTATDNQSFAFKSYGYRNYIGPMVTYCYVMKFNNNWTDIQYSVNDIVIDEFNATIVPRQIVSSITVPAHNYTMTFASVNTTSPPILNALETYILNNWNTSFTTIADVNAITNVKQAFNLVDWSGDPCLPSPYDWLNCTSFQDTSESDDERDIKYSPVTYKITGLSLVNGAARATDRNAVAEITSLTNLNTLNLSDNGISNSSINLSHLANLSILDVSNNNFSGEVVDFARSVGISNVQELYMSGNNFSSFSSKPSSPLFRNLTKLDLSRNRIEGDVMDFMTSIGDHFITQLYAAYNFLEGQFRLSEFKNIEILDFDGQNINGTLDLSDWNSHTMVTQLIKLRNNSIEDVYPSLDKLSWIINNASIYAPIYFRGSSMDANQGAILLNGNPWCQAIDNKTLAQRYLCRNNSTDFVDYNDVGVPRPKSDKISWAEILGISIGAGVLILSFKICFAILLRKLKKKSDELAEIQEALTKQKVYPPMYSYAELRSATKNFAHCNNLGQGAYGAVYMGKMTDGTQVAVKKLFQDHQVLDEFLNEAVLITGIKHRNLAQLKGCCIDQGQRILVYEYAENGNLAEALWGQFDSMKKTESMNWERRLNICMGIARGLSYLHEELQPRIIHRDIKPANILIDGNFNAKIADFGLARSFLEEQTQADFTHVAGTLGYLAPEYVTQGLLTEKADIFSCGVVLLEVVSGRKCIDQSLPSEKVSLVNWANTLRETGNVMDILDLSIQSSCNDEEALQVIDIAFSCLQTEPSQRPTMSQVVIMLQPRLQGNASSFSRPLPGFNSISATTR